MTFVLDDGWTGFRHYQDSFSIGKAAPTVFLSMVSDIAEGFGGVGVSSGPAGFEALLRSIAPLEVDAPVPTTVGGMPAVQIDVVASAPVRALYTVKKDQYNLESGQKARFFIVDDRGTSIVFVIESTTEAEFDGAVAAAQPVLDSLAFE